MGLTKFKHFSLIHKKIEKHREIYNYPIIKSCKVFFCLKLKISEDSGQVCFGMVLGYYPNLPNPTLEARCLAASKDEELKIGLKIYKVACFVLKLL